MALETLFLMRVSLVSAIVYLPRVREIFLAARRNCLSRKFALFANPVMYFLLVTRRALFLKSTFFFWRILLAFAIPFLLFFSRATAAVLAFAAALFFANTTFLFN